MRSQVPWNTGRAAAALISDLSFLIREPADLYHDQAGAYLTSHLLADFRKSPLLYHRKRVGLIPDEDRPAYRVGRAAHSLILEGRPRFDEDYAVGGPVNPKTGNVYGANTKAFAEWAAAQGKPVLTREQLDLLLRMHLGVVRNDVALGLLAKGVAEGVVRAEYCGVECQIRMDWLNPHLGLVDLKTCDDLTWFEADARRYGYPFVPVASSVPPAGAVVTSYGYPQTGDDRQLTWGTGVLVRGSSFEFRGRSFRGNVVSIVSGPGWSGGPLLDRDHHVIGLLSSGDRYSSVFISFAAVRRAYDAVAVAPTGKPTLYVFHSQTCGPCRKFDADYADDAAFRQAIEGAFDVVPVDVDERPGTAREFGITEVPTFVVPGRPPIVGYDDPDELLRSLGIDQTAPVTTPAEPVPTEPVSTPTEPEQPLAEPPTVPQPVDAESPQSDLSGLEVRIDRVVGVAQTALTVATWLGLSGTTGGIAGAILGGIALVRSVRKRRREEPAARDPPAAAPPPVITVDAPPPAPVIVPEMKFAPYERDTFAQAFAWAQGELARKYPGSVGTLETLKGLIDQFLSAKGVRVNADS
jgi:thiol-disulfide isomerase/thioredoxin